MKAPDFDWQQIVDRYEPAWMPSSGELDGLVVAIDSRGGSAPQPDQQAADDLALMTGLHLFHLVQAAGGVPLVMRTDERPGPCQGSDGTEAGRPVGSPFADADVTVSIRFGPGCGKDEGSIRWKQIQPYSNAAQDRALAHAMAQAFGADSNAANQTGACEADDRCGVLICAEIAVGHASTDRLAKLPRNCAEQIVRGLAGFGATHQAELVGERDRRDEDQPLPTPVPRFFHTSTEQDIAATARRIWPEGDLPIEKAAWFCSMFGRVSLSDRTFVHFQPRVTVEGDTVVVGGATNIACMRDTLAQALRVVGIESTRTEMRLLPEEGRADGAQFGVCVAPIALTYAEPCATAGPQTQLQFGEPVMLLDAADDHLLVHASDGYWGWVQADCIRTTSEDEFNSCMTAVDAGASGTIDIRIRAALDLLHRPYLFGGVSPRGLDCSGLVRNVFDQTGVTLGRDAAQQFQQGRLVATRWRRGNIRAGDLLFFINPCGKIYHVAVALSPTHYVHAASPEVQINSLRKGDRLYHEVREGAFFAAKRP